MGKMIRRQKNNKGFTLAELMMAVAIIIILMGVAFVGVNRYLRSMGLLERDGVAKELFIAAQNHLTMAQGQGYLKDSIYYGKKDETSGTKDAPVYLISVDSADDFKVSSIASLMLPLGSMEETIRTNGNYVIRYQPKTAKVMDVFYCTNASGRFDSTLTVDTVQAILKGKYIQDFNYKESSDRKEDFIGEKKQDSILGWFGGETADELEFADVQDPTLELVNGDILYAKITNPNETKAVKLQVFVEGVSSGISGYFEYTGDDAKKGDIFLVLDDITNKDKMISNVLKTDGKGACVKDGSSVKYVKYQVSSDNSKTFIPGEDIRVYVKALKTNAISRIGRSQTKTTNSLFESIVSETPATVSGVDYTTMYIGSIRHLENLNNHLSGLAKPNTSVQTMTGDTQFQSKFSLTKAVQTKPLVWERKVKTGTPQENGYIQNIIALYSSDSYLASVNTDSFNKDKKPHVYTGDAAEPYTNNGCYLPISPDYSLEYDGKGFRISDVYIDYNNSAGLIGEMKGGSFANMRLENFEVKTSSGNAGALAGSLTKQTELAANVTNVLAYNNGEFKKGDAPLTSNIQITSGSGAAGGLIGYIEGSSRNAVNACAAALYVDSSGDAGGLIGKIEGPVTLRHCYSGGHTINGTAAYHTPAKYWESTSGAGEAAADKVNVKGGGNAGGLVGDAGGSGSGTSGGPDIQACYSTCSVYGAGYVGGFVGKAVKNLEYGSIDKCYSTGYVSGPANTGDSSDIEDKPTLLIKKKIGAFAGDLGGITPSNCNYYMIVNERFDAVKGFKYLSPVGDKDPEAVSGIEALDKDPGTYDTFSGSDWKAAYPYDEILATYYKVNGENKYNLKTVYQLDGNGTPPTTPTDESDYFVKDHYGDWPAPEIFVINVK